MKTHRETTDSALPEIHSFVSLPIKLVYCSSRM